MYINLNPKVLVAASEFWKIQGNIFLGRDTLH